MTTVSCMHCMARLILKEGVAAGRKLKCPKCGKPFVAGGADDDPWNPGPATDEDEGLSGPRSSAKPRPRQASGTSGRLLIGGVWGASLLLGPLVGAWLAGAFSRTPDPQVAAAAPETSQKPAPQPTSPMAESPASVASPTPKPSPATTPAPLEPPSREKTSNVTTEVASNSTPAPSTIEATPAPTPTETTSETPAETTPGDPAEGPLQGATFSRITDKLPADTVVFAKTNLSNLEEGDGRGGVLGKPFEIHLGIHGGAMRNAVEIGKLNVTTATADDGKPLKFFTQHGASNDYTKGFFEINRKGAGFLAQPEGGAETLFFVHVAPQSLKSVRKLTGTFVVRVAGKTQEIQLDKLPELIGKPSTDPDLKAAGFQLKKVVKDGETTLTAQVRTPNLIQDVEVTNSDREKFEFRVDLPEKDAQGNLIHRFSFGSDPITNTHGLKFVLYTEVKATMIPFDFENVPLMRVESKE